MLVKFGSLVAAERTTISEWRELIVAASVNQDADKIEALAEFEIDRDNFLYVRARAVSAGEHYGANDNGDFFPEAELEKYHKTFVRRGVYVNHKSDDPAGAIGIIIDAVWHGDKRKYVECLLAIDRSEPIAKKIESGIAHSWSMGALVKECECNLCGKKASTEAEYCEHLSQAMGREYQGRKVWAINHGLSFYELSNVTVPADPNAFTLQVLAESKALSAKLTALADAYQKKVEQASSKKEASVAVSEVREKIAGKSAAPRTDRQILGTVRHRLKAPAPNLPREGVHQRVSALEAGGARREPQKTAIAETNPLEGLNVENNLTIRYLPGDSLKDCFFVARKGNLQVMKTASELLDVKVQKAIVASEKGGKPVTAAEKAERIKDDSKPSPDNEWHPSQEGADPKSKVNPLSANPAKDMKDDSKPSPDSTHELGKDPIQPSDVVKKYAQLLGATNVTFKKGEKGSFTAFLSSGSIARLAGLWNTQPRLVRKANIAKDSPEYAREEARGEGRDPKNKSEMSWAREPMTKDLAKPGSGSAGGEQKAFYQGFSSKDLPAGGADMWARKVNELTRVASSFEKDIKALKAENDVLRKTIEAAKQASVEKEKAHIIAGLISQMEKMGAIRADHNEVFDLKDRGLSHEEAEVKAYALAIDRKRAELKDLDVKALNAMLSNISDLGPSIQAKASKKDMEIPRASRDEQFVDDADRLAQGW